MAAIRGFVATSVWSERAASRSDNVVQPLPGSINVGFVDDHFEKVKLDSLWRLYWHQNYEPQFKRPSLL